jgi:hypothetical protein
MEFVRKKVKGKRQDTFQRWVSDCGAYRVEWRAELGLPAWYATVDVGWMWAFAGKRGPYRTRKAAERACVQHRKAWERYMTADRAKRADLRRLRVGKGDQINALVKDPPAWCARDRRLGALGQKSEALQAGRIEATRGAVGEESPCWFGSGPVDVESPDETVWDDSDIGVLVTS